MANRHTTGRGLSADEAFVGLVDYGLFAERLPPCFTSEGLSVHVPQCLLAIATENTKRSLVNLLKNRMHDFIRYESLRHVKVFRPMGVPHPESHIIQCLALKRHWQEIKEHCAKPSVPVSRIFVRETDDRRVFRMDYKGKDRFNSEELDIRNRMGSHFVVRTDISTCFPSIYTHSVPWALHGRSRSKKDRSILLPGNLLDKATQATRDGQTNGLVIGPHTSNVISEIILTKIDHEMIQKGYRQFTRHIDDYTFYAKTYKQAEDFIRDIGMQLREYELVLNERKTAILPLPLPDNENWVRELNSFQWPANNECIRFGTVNSLLDLALNLSHGAENFAVLNYAFKMVPPRLNNRARRLFIQQAVNLALLYPYLAPILDNHVFDKHSYHGIKGVIREFVDELLEIGVQKIHSDAIAHALYYSLKHHIQFSRLDKHLEEIIKIDDCISHVLLLLYAQQNGITDIEDKIRARADGLSGMEAREKDRYWLLIYQVWCENKLQSEGQPFLAKLKKAGFSFGPSPKQPSQKS